MTFKNSYVLGCLILLFTFDSNVLLYYYYYYYYHCIHLTDFFQDNLGKPAPES